MDVCDADQLGSAPTAGCGTLLHDANEGDATLFQHADPIEAGWAPVQPVLDVWQALPPREFPNDRAGTWGPSEVDQVQVGDGRAWKNAQGQPVRAAAIR